MFSACLRANFAALVLKIVTTYPPPPTHPFLKWPFLTDFKKYTHNPPYGTRFWCFGEKIEQTLKKCEFALCWQVMNVPERYAKTNAKRSSGLGGGDDFVWGFRHRVKTCHPCEFRSSYCLTHTLHCRTIGNL